MQYLRAPDLRRKDVHRLLCGPELNQTAAWNSGRMDHAVNGAECFANLRCETFHGGLVGHIDARGQNLGSGGLHGLNFTDPRRSAVIVRVRLEPLVPLRSIRKLRTAGQDQLRLQSEGEMPRKRETDSAEAARDQVNTLLAK